MSDDEKPKRVKRGFSSLNHPEPTAMGFDESGKAVFVQLYSVHEIFADPDAPHGVRYVRVADNLTSIEVTKFIRDNNGEWQEEDDA